MPSVTARSYIAQELVEKLQNLASLKFCTSSFVDGTWKRVWSKLHVPVAGYSWK